MLLRLVCADEGVLSGDQSGPRLLGVEGAGLLGAHQAGALRGQASLLRDAPAAVHDVYLSGVLLCVYIPRLAAFCAENILPRVARAQEAGQCGPGVAGLAREGVAGLVQGLVGEVQLEVPADLLLQGRGRGTSGLEVTPSLRLGLGEALVRGVRGLARRGAEDEEDGGKGWTEHWHCPGDAASAVWGGVSPLYTAWW